jgi:anaerobic ribonucleoside-triphosphate reductase activating protein
MNYMQIDKASISDGKGFRVVLYCSGCELKCEGCFNPETWKFESGKLFDEDAYKYLFDQLNKPWIQGITFSGGNPLDTPYPIFSLAQEIRKKFPSKDIWLYSGYTYEQICQSREKFKVLTAIDVLVDGPYIESQRDITLPFRGSKNQRIIDVKKTLQQNEVVLLDI